MEYKLWICSVLHKESELFFWHWFDSSSLQDKIKILRISKTPQSETFFSDSSGNSGSPIRKTSSWFPRWHNWNFSQSGIWGVETWFDFWLRFWFRFSFFSLITIIPLLKMPVKCCKHLFYAFLWSIVFVESDNWIGLWCCGSGRVENVYSGFTK